MEKHYEMENKNGKFVIDLIDYNDFYHNVVCTMNEDFFGKYQKEYYGEYKKIYIEEFIKKTHDYMKIIQCNHRIIGMLVVDFNAEKVYIEYIALISGFRNKLIGTFLLDKVLSEAKDLNKPVILEVYKSNPANKLYSKLGFKTQKSDEANNFMEKSK